MSKVASVRLIAVAGAAAASVWAVETAPAASEDGAALQVVEAMPGGVHALGASANLTMRFIQEDGPESGHVRVVLTPETRPLTVLEARGAAQQAFLETLKEKGLGDGITRITVVVRLMPRSHPDPTGSEQVIVFVHKGGSDWSVRAGE